MKKIILVIILFTFSNSYSQKTKDSLKIKKNEFKVNVASFIDKYPEFTYERLINDETAFGLSIGFSIENNTDTETDNTTNYNFSIIPYYRFFFGKKPAAGFFIEANAPLFSQKYIDGSFFNNQSEGGLGFGLGLSIGGKFMTKSGWIGEIYSGLARSFINTDKVRQLYPRAGITIGKRF
ncbi:DUF3575 domain-containing protein [Polaribacter pectinis]|uniref:DUF3575 domain-containing protein n=1 Tax=Polaribacter pectinis TaxID=2738844 RepID=A0A7G9LBB6_9FLAO|nr:DUF3575 domain-containing protein [Polaribacter pectinis]QNM85915.1 DUF3575 domain-containing protein [Polaribacter pectinis]